MKVIISVIVYRIVTQKGIGNILVWSSIGIIAGIIIMFSSVTIEKRIDESLTLIGTVIQDFLYVLNYLIIDYLLPYFIMPVVFS